MKLKSMYQGKKVKIANKVRIMDFQIFFILKSLVKERNEKGL